MTQTQIEETELEDLLDIQGDGANPHTFLSDKYGIARNPFPPAGVADAGANNAPLQSDTKSLIFQYLRNTIATGNSEYLVIRGDYGTGKTHTLRYIEHLVNERLNRGEGSPRAIYVERPRLEAHELNRTIMRSLGHDTIRKYIWYAVQQQLKLEINNPSSELRDFENKLVTIATKGRKAPLGPTLTLSGYDREVAESIWSKIFSVDSISDHRKFFDELEKLNFNRDDASHYLSHLLLESVGGDRSTELATAFATLLIARDEKTFTSWENLLSISNNKSLTSLQAPTFLQFLLAIMKRNGVSYVYLLLDEFEEVPQGFLLTPRQRQDYLYTMREVFNRIQTGLGVVIAISPAGWDALSGIGTPLKDVISKAADLQAFSSDDAVALFNYFTSRVINENRRTSELLTEELIHYIADHFPARVQRTPRSFIQFLHQLVNYIDLKQITEINEEVIQEVMGLFTGMKAEQATLPSGRIIDGDI